MATIATATIPRSKLDEISTLLAEFRKTIKASIDDSIELGAALGRGVEERTKAAVVEEVIWLEQSVELEEGEVVESETNVGGGSEREGECWPEHQVSGVEEMAVDEDSGTGEGTAEGLRGAIGDVPREGAYSEEPSGRQSQAETRTGGIQNGGATHPSRAPLLGSDRSRSASLEPEASSKERSPNPTAPSSNAPSSNAPNPKPSSSLSSMLFPNDPPPSPPPPPPPPLPRQNSPALLEGASPYKLTQLQKDLIHSRLSLAESQISRSPSSWSPSAHNLKHRLIHLLHPKIPQSCLNAAWSFASCYLSKKRKHYPRLTSAMDAAKVQSKGRKMEKQRLRQATKDLEKEIEEKRKYLREFEERLGGGFAERARTREGSVEQATRALEDELGRRRVEEGGSLEARITFG